MALLWSHPGDNRTDLTESEQRRNDLAQHVCLDVQEISSRLNETNTNNSLMIALHALS
jgi:hypothetical protein